MKLFIKTAGGLVTALDPLLKKIEGLWIGWDGAIGSSNKIKDKLRSGKTITQKDMSLN